MLVQLSSDQEFFRDTTAKFLREQVPVAQLRRLRDDPAGFAADYWRRGAELGWTSLLVDETHGGGTISGNGLVDLTLVAQEFGRFAAPGPLIPANVVACALNASGTHDDVLAHLLAGTSIATWCFAEGPPNDGLGTVTLDISREGDELVLNGVKRPVEAAAQANHLLVTGRTGDGLTQVLVPTNTAGISVAPMHSADLTRRFSVVTFDKVRVSAGSVAGEVAKADADVERQLQHALVMMNAEALGAMQTAFDMTVEWLHDRYSFGRPLGSYQAIKHRLADMKAWLEAGHAISDEAAAAVASGAHCPTCREAGVRGVSSENIEDVESFRHRARAWIRQNLRATGPVTLSLRNDRTDSEELAGVARDREVQRMLFDAGLAGLCIPREYGGQGLTPAHQQVLNEELAGYEYPMRLQAPTFTPCAAVLLEFGTEEQKLRHIPAILKGEEIWMQFLSEPSGGSDVAGALTSAVRDGEEWVLNGNREFCQEFLSGVRVPDSDRIGEVDDGWTVGTRWMFHERMLYNSPFVTFPASTIRGADGASWVLDVARASGRLKDHVARELAGEARMLEVVGDALKRRIGQGISSGTMSDQASAIARLFSAVASARRTTIAFELAGSAGAAWTDDDGRTAGCGTDFLMRQTTSIGGGTTEMARNVVSERVLGMPREHTLDRELPFRDVPRGYSRG